MLNTLRGNTTAFFNSLKVSQELPSPPPLFIQGFTVLPQLISNWKIVGYVGKEHNNYLPTEAQVFQRHVQ